MGIFAEMTEDLIFSIHKFNITMLAIGFLENTKQSEDRLYVEKNFFLIENCLYKFLEFYETSTYFHFCWKFFFEDFRNIDDINNILRQSLWYYKILWCWAKGKHLYVLSNIFLYLTYFTFWDNSTSIDYWGNFFAMRKSAVKVNFVVKVMDSNMCLT